MTASFWSFAGRAVVALTIALLFLSVLIISSIQQTVATAVSQSTLKTDWNTGLRIVREAQDRADSLASLKADRARQSAQARRLQTAAERLGSLFFELVGDALPVIVAVADSGECPALRAALDRPNSNAVDHWRALQICYQGGNVPPRWRTSVASLLQRPDTAISLRQRLDRTELELRSRTSEIARLDTEINATQAAIPTGNNLDMLTYLLELPVIGTFGLVDIPPPMMQIILSFVSGLFGALVITLVVAVYPDNSASFSRSEHYYHRLFLGGLVSILIFVLLGGGLVVLGTSGGVFQGGGNYLSFCAIGIVAGMFSDRVALWVSEHLDTILARNPGRHNQAAAGRGGVDTTGGGASGGGGQPPARS